METGKINIYLTSFLILMVVIFISIFVILGMTTEPKFVYGQEVKYKVTKFYKNVCGDRGEIIDFSCSSVTCSYTIYPLTENSGCPTYFHGINEGDIEAVK